MKLNKYNQFFEEYNLNIRPAKKVLNSKKLSHSQRVAEMVVKLENREDLYQASFYHDFLERGGSLNKLFNLISPYSIELVQALSKDEGVNDTLEALKNTIINKSDRFVADVLLIKLVDRWDNLTTKNNEGDLNRKYLKKSRELVSYIYSNYPNDKSKIESFIAQYMSPILNIEL